MRGLALVLFLSIAAPIHAADDLLPRANGLCSSVREDCGRAATRYCSSHLVTTTTVTSGGTTTTETATVGGRTKTVRGRSCTAGGAKVKRAPTPAPPQCLRDAAESGRLSKACSCLGVAGSTETQTVTGGDQTVTKTTTASATRTLLPNPGCGNTDGFTEYYAGCGFYRGSGGTFYYRPDASLPACRAIAKCVARAPSTSNSIEILFSVSEWFCYAYNDPSPPGAAAFDTQRDFVGSVYGYFRQSG